MVEIQNLTKYYGSKAALKGISFTIKENEVLGFSDRTVPEVYYIKYYGWCHPFHRRNGKDPGL